MPNMSSSLDSIQLRDFWWKREVELFIIEHLGILLAHAPKFTAKVSSAVLWLIIHSTSIKMERILSHLVFNC